MKTYSKKELATLYMPEATIHAARKQLSLWIRHNKDLQNELKAAGYQPRKKLLTPRQLEIIFRYLGEP